MSSPSDRLAQLEAEVAELRAIVTPPASTAAAVRRPRIGLVRRLALIGVALALIIPAGVVLAGGPSFTDVPTTHKFYNDIEALAASGITSGCTTTRYCPDGLVTRGQMAAFLNRLGALAPGKAPKVNADRVDGRHANQLIRVADQQIGATTLVPATGAQVQYGSDLKITAPTNGFILVSAQVTYSSSNCTGDCWAATRIELVGGPSSNYSMTTVHADDTFNSTAPQRAFAVNAGVNTFRVMSSRGVGAGTVNAFWGAVNATFIPYGSTGGATLGLTGDEPAVGAPADAAR
jgi:hypothetical protein